VKTPLLRQELDYFVRPIDVLPHFRSKGLNSWYEILRDHFFGIDTEWWQLYDLIELLLSTEENIWRDDLSLYLNECLNSENAAYRVIDGKIVPITNELEIESISSSIDTGTPSVQSHLKRALELFSDRNGPDYRNSIKESISAVESACKDISGKPNATLSDALKALKKHTPIHPSFDQALNKLYAFTNDEGGIRHALTEESVQPSFSDAKLMLVVCSAFTNYLLTTSSQVKNNL